MLALSVFGVSTLDDAALSLFVQVPVYWNIVAFLPLMALIVGWVPSSLAAGPSSGGYGLVFAVGCTVNFTAVPLASQSEAAAMTGLPRPPSAGPLSPRASTR